MRKSVWIRYVLSTSSTDVAFYAIIMSMKHCRGTLRGHSRCWRTDPQPGVQCRSWLVSAGSRNQTNRLQLSPSRRHFVTQLSDNFVLNNREGEALYKKLLSDWPKPRPMNQDHAKPLADMKDIDI